VGEQRDRPLSWLDADVPDASITKAVDSLAAFSALAIDTEADSFYRYHERVCLLQISTPGTDLLVDPLSVGLPASLRALLEDPARLWVLHGGDFDVLSLNRDFDLKFGRLFDSMFAARFLGLPGFGLAAVLESELGVTIKKTSQRSDWGRRPLTKEQIDYAREDTAHLLPLVEVLRVKLRDIGRLHWVEEECELLRHRVPTPKVFDPDGWWKIKGVKSLGEPGRRAARAAYLWRDRLADRKNRAPFRVLGNDAILAAANAVDRDGPEVLDRLDRIRGIPKRFDTRGLATSIREGLATTDPIDRRPKGKNDRPRKLQLDANGKTRLNAVKKVRDSSASELMLDPGLLLPTALAEAIACDHPRDVTALSAVKGMTSWRIEALATPLLEALA